MASWLRLGSRLSLWIWVFALASVSVVQAQDSLDTVHLEEIAVFGTGITQNDVRYTGFLVSPDQRHIAIHVNNNTARSSDFIEVWALETQNLVTIIDRPFGRSTFGVFAWSPDSAQLATIANETDLFIWDAFTGELVRTHVGLDVISNGVRRVHSIAWPQPDTITTGSFGYLVWDLSADTPPRIVDCHPWGSWLWWSPNGQYVATMGGESTLVWICDNQFNQLVSFEGYRTIAWSPDSTEIASVGLYNSLRIWDIASGEAVVTSSGGENNILHIAWHLTDRIIVTGHLNGELRIWQRETFYFQPIGEFNIPGLKGVEWLGDQLITITDTGLIQIWEMIRE